MIPDDVVVQVLTQCREELIDRTFESIEGCKQAVVHIYNSTSTLQRDVVFHKDKPEIIDIALEGTRMVKERAAKFPGKIILEYSPESFTGTEPEFAAEIFRQAEVSTQVIPVESDAYPTKAVRPKNSRMSKKSLDDAGFERLPSWKDAVGRYLIELAAEHEHEMRKLVSR